MQIFSLISILLTTEASVQMKQSPSLVYKSTQLGRKLVKFRDLLYSATEEGEDYRSM